MTPEELVAALGGGETYTAEFKADLNDDRLV